MIVNTRMINKTILAILISLCATAVMMSSCNTGIESTRAIKMSKSDKRAALPTEEELFAEKFASAPLGEWKSGKAFLVADDKASLLYKPDGDVGSSELKGDTLLFESVALRPTPGDEQAAVIRFRSKKEGILYNYATGKSLNNVSTEITGLDLPALIDLDVVREVGDALRGKQLWILSSLWYDAEGNVIHGLKFVPVTVTAVSSGNLFFPVTVEFTDGRTHSKVFMNVHNSSGIGGESRTFPSLFSLSDPKLNYQSVSPEVWRLIQQGRVATGMTKEECRLSLGNPPDVDSGHDWNNTIDIWRYKDGTFLHFQDGLLVNYRH